MEEIQRLYGGDFRGWRLRITVGYPEMAQKGSGRYVFEAVPKAWTGVVRVL